MFATCVQQNIPKLLVVLKLLCIVQVRKLVLPVLQLVFSATGVQMESSRVMHTLQSMPSKHAPAQHCCTHLLLEGPQHGTDLDAVLISQHSG